MKTEHKIVLIAILMIFGLEFYALSMGIDGTLFAAAVGGISAIAGYVIKGRRNS
jgi:hypothetical protein